MKVNNNTVISINCKIYSYGEEIYANTFSYLYNKNGENGFFPEVDEAIYNKNVGEKILNIKIDDKFCIKPLEELILQEKRSDFFEKVEIGDVYELDPIQNPNLKGTYKVTKIDDEFVYLDGNHPLAGKRGLTANVKIISVRPATPFEIKQGHISNKIFPQSVK